jgi:hypothetical protein
MTTIYLKSADEKTVVSIHGIEPCPDNYLMLGYTVIEYGEFRRIKFKIHRNLISEETI